MKPRTLLWQLGLVLMGAQALATALLAWYAAAQFATFNRHQTVAELQRASPIIAHHYAQMLARGALPAELDAAAKRDTHADGLRITIIAPDGSVIADSDADPATMENHAMRPEVAAALRGQAGAHDVRTSATTRKQTTYLAQPLVVDGQVAAVVRTALPLEAVRGEPAQVARLVGLAALVSLALTFLLFYFVSRRLSRSIQRLAHGAEQFARGDLAHRIDRPQSLELAALADGLNEMAQHLSEQIEAMQAQRNEQQAIYQSMSNGLLALDREQRIISVNRAAERLLGLDGPAVRGRLLQEVLREPELHRFVADALEENTSRAIGEQNDQASIGEFPLRQPVGAAPARRVQAASQPLRNAREQVVGLLVLMTDVTELRRLETIRSDFAANVSHELRTPITMIKGYVETMLEVGVRDVDQTRRFLEIIGRNTARLSSIIEDLLALARLEQPDKRATLDKQNVDVQRSIDATLAQFEADIREKAMRIVTFIEPGLRVMANVQLLEQALGNLISNAVKYSGAGTAITISAAKRGMAGAGSNVEIAVADEGPGIPAEHQSRIFERFYRVDRARSREMGGTGLGLSIVKHIALVHGGAITVESEVGKGSTFRLLLPASEEPVGMVATS